MRRRTATRDRHRQTIRRTGADCGICGQPIDYSLPHMDPGEFVVDHIVPLTHGGIELDVLSNKQASHRACNRAKGARLDGGPVIRRSRSLARPGAGVTPAPRA